MHAYLDYVSTNKSTGTLKRERLVINALTSFFGNILLSHIDSLSVERYKSRRKENGLSPAGINRELQVLSCMLNKAIEWRLITTKPIIKKLIVPKLPPKYLSMDEMHSLIDNSNNWLKPILLILKNTGIRLGELLNLKFSDIDMKNKTITIRSSKTHNYRLLPINSELYEVFETLQLYYTHPSTQRTKPRTAIQMNYVICFPDGSRMKSIRTSFTKACSRAGIKATPHTIRHSVASTLTMNGTDIVTVMQLLGHSQISSTLVYSHVSEQHKHKELEKLTFK